MKKISAWRVSLALFLFLSGCAGAAPPLVLYPGPVRPSDEIAVVQVVKTHARGGSPTLQILNITVAGEEERTLYRASSGSGWDTPEHFGGPAGGADRTRGRGRDIPERLEILPGLYRIDFSYAPATDRYGWTHRTTGTSTTWLECRAGYTYLLEGRWLEGGGGWFLNTVEVFGGG